MESLKSPPRLQLSGSTIPQCDADTYYGRLQYFWRTTHPQNFLLTAKQLENAKILLESYKEGKEPDFTRESDVLSAKYQYESSYHPITGKVIPSFYRMAAQMPSNALIIGSMLSFYKTFFPGYVFMQVANQEFNTLVNFENRSGHEVALGYRLIMDFVAGFSSCLALYGIHILGGSADALSPWMRMCRPFASIAVANMINIPVMRSADLINGTMVYDENGQELTTSRVASLNSTMAVVVSRILMAFPALIIPPLLIEKTSAEAFFKRRPMFRMPFMIGLVSLCFTATVPLCCALFPQKWSLAVNQLEEEAQEEILEFSKNRGIQIDKIYFNKGL